MRYLNLTLILCLAVIGCATLAAPSKIPADLPMVMQDICNAEGLMQILEREDPRAADAIRRLCAIFPGE